MKGIKKTMFALLGMAVLVLAFPGCKDDTGGLYVNPNNVHHTECLLHTDALAKGFENPDEVSVEYNNGVVHVLHRNLLVNCGTAQIEGGINVTCTLNGSTVDIYEQEDENNPMANCICEVDNEFDIRGLEPGTYTFVFHSWYPEPQSFTFTF